MTPAAIPLWLGDAIAAAGVSGRWVARDRIGEMPGLKGAYVLALRLDLPVAAELPRRAPVVLPPGWYLYLGSARGPGGLRARVGRHFRRGKAAHWHIDRLTAAAAQMAALAVEDGHECALADRLRAAGSFEAAAPGFGSTDCRRCESHLLSAAGARI